jgi:outer membrane lipoprotein-sorting protein
MINKNDCKSRREQITALVLGELEPKSAEELRSHIESCETCKSLYQSLADEEESIRSAFKVIAERGEILQSSLIEQFEKNEPTAVKRDERAGKAVRIIWRTIMKNRITKFATAAAIIIAVLTAIHFSGGSIEGVAFAEAVRPVLDARTAFFDVALESGNRPVQKSHFLCMSPGLVRQTMSDGTINIVNYQQSTALCLNPKEKKAKLIRMIPSRGVGSSDVLGQMQQRIRRAVNLSDKSVEHLGHKFIDGRDAIGFRVELSGEQNYLIGWQRRGTFTIWVDPNMKYPVQLEWYDQMTGINSIATNIKLDVDLDKTLFSMEIPEGYALTEETEKGPEDLPTTVDEKKIITNLRQWTDLTGGVFPSSVDGWSAIKDLDPNADISFEQKEWNGFNGYVHVNMPNLKTYLKVMQLISSGGVIGPMPKGAEWHYAGKGVKIGDADTAIFWYKLKGDENYRVIYGDLTVKDVPPEKLPK